MISILSISVLALVVGAPVSSFSPEAYPTNKHSSPPPATTAAAAAGSYLTTSTTLTIPTRHRFARTLTSLSVAAASTEIEIDADRSTLTLLEHVNLNVPNHDYILDFYFDLLGFGCDPRVAINLMEHNDGDDDDDDETIEKAAPFSIEEGLVWPNCGASQFHLPRADEAQSIPGHIGLRYKALKGLKERLAAAEAEAEDDSNSKCFSSYGIYSDANGDEFVSIDDRYGNTFQCREGPEKLAEFEQPVLRATQFEEFAEVARRYGREESECRGIDYVEFDCPEGSADAIAGFYDSVFDATTSVIDSNGQGVALVAFGLVDEAGRAEQYLIFRETADVDAIPEYDGHHVSIYVGRSKEDFEQVFRNAELADVVWVNPRFADRVTTLSGAKSLDQFRFKDIVDVETGNPVFQLEHEIRSVEHPSWPGKKKTQ